jgi:hypothetical protein
MLDLLIIWTALTVDEAKDCLQPKEDVGNLSAKDEISRAGVEF